MAKIESVGWHADFAEIFGLQAQIQKCLESSPDVGCILPLLEVC